MDIDMSQFYEVFFEESFEGLDVMEAELLALQPGTEDDETINTIFRAAHSIKGGSGTFGFTQVSDFTHVLETLLDQIREGSRQLEQAHIDLLLLSVDCLRGILAALQASEEPDMTEADKLKQDFEAILNQGGAAQATPEEKASEAVKNAGWKIYFKPGLDVLRSGNEPSYMLMELADFGEVEVVAETSDIKGIDDIDPESCYISWNITLNADVEQSKIEEVFEWVVDESDIKIEAIAGEATETAAEETQVKEVEGELVKAEPQAASEPKAAPRQVQKKEQTKNKGETNSIRVSIDKVDSLINMVGELVITQAMLTQLSEGELDQEKLDSLREGLVQLAHNTRDLQESVMQIRMLPISFVFSRFPRVVRDTSQKLGKQVELKLSGEGTELDKTVMENIVDPMVHLVRNSLDHGIEMPDVRVAAGKPAHGTVTLNAFHQGGNIVIEIIDDGAGLNTDKILSKARSNGLVGQDEELSQEQIHDLIFRPGFSTADTVSDISGRGVGMDVVRRNIQGLNGSIEVVSEQGMGSTFTIRLPLTLAILDGQLVKIGVHTYIIPLISIVESLQIDMEKVNVVGGGLEVLRLREEYVPIIRLYDLFEHQAASTSLEDGLLVVVESDNEKVGLLVDDLLAQQQVVIKSLEANYRKVEGVSGATILGDGTVSLIIDIIGLIKQAGLKRAGSKGMNLNVPLETAV